MLLIFEMMFSKIHSSKDNVYTVGLAQMFPDKNFVGVDELLGYIRPQSVAEIWITFPDPLLRLAKIA